MKRILVTLACLWLIVGCAVSKDGISVAHRPPDADKVAQVHDQLQENADTLPSASSGPDEVAKNHPGILVIGTTGPFRSIEDKDRDSFYAAYRNSTETASRKPKANGRVVNVASYRKT
jgi:hypothetical protein